MLPDSSNLKKLYVKMMQLSNGEEKKNQEEFLRSQIVAGGIDVNIMTKVDREHLDSEGQSIPDHSEAVSALRGYANSNLSNSSIIFSAGLNPRLYNYLESLNAFDPSDDFTFKKKVVVKVSDYRSALIQGKYLAKKGVWVSEFRIESGLNCGGHAFASDGFMLGPILEEFKAKRDELSEAMFATYKPFILHKLGIDFTQAPAIDITVQGGIGTHEEDQLLLDYYQVARTGWGTPFLLVPEATTVDENTLSLLENASENDIHLSKNSPLGVRFHYLKGTTSDIEKNGRALRNKPGSPCTEKHLAFNTEFTKEPICTASLKYQKLKIEELKTLGLNEEEFTKQKQRILDKECLCIGLSNAAALNYKQPFLKDLHAVNICPGPNIVNFSKIVSLQTMTDHIYGRTNIMENASRPHMFIAELKLYITYVQESLEDEGINNLDKKRRAYYKTFFAGLNDAIQYYRDKISILLNQPSVFLAQLNEAEQEIHAIETRYLPEAIPA